MIHVILDSSIYRSDPARRRLPFKTLGGLCEKDLVKLHVPSIVKREFTTFLALEAEAVLAEAVRAVKKLSRSPGPKDEQTFVGKTLEELTNFVGRYKKHAERSFNEWMQEVKAVQDEIRGECLQDVVDSYFEGRMAFKKIKSREDFPDAFIWQIVKDIVTKENQLFAVIADNNLRKAVSQIPNVEVFHSLETFIESQRVQELFPENFARKHEIEILNLFKYNPWVLEEPIADGIEAELRDTSISYTAYESVDADILDIEAVDNVMIDFGNAHYFGDNLFRIPFSARAKMLLDYFMDKYTYYGIPDAESDQIEVQDSDWNKSTMWVQEARYFQIQGELSLSVDMTELIKKSDGGLDSDTVLYGSEITVDELDRPELI